MSERMSDERLADLDRHITNSCGDGYDCNCDNAPCGLEPREAREMLAELKRLRKEMAELGEITAEWSVIRHWPAGAKPGESLTEEEARGFVRRHPGGGIRVALGRRFVGEWREVEES